MTAYHRLQCVRKSQTRLWMHARMWDLLMHLQSVLHRHLAARHALDDACFDAPCTSWATSTSPGLLQRPSWLSAPGASVWILDLGLGSFMLSFSPGTLYRSQFFSAISFGTPLFPDSAFGLQNAVAVLGCLVIQPRWQVRDGTLMLPLL